MKSYDLIIAGAGPAGMQLAASLARSGVSILMLDKKSNAADAWYNTSGSFLRPDDFGLPKHVFHRIDEIYFASRNETSRISVPLSIINRKALLEFLEKQALANPGLEIRYKARITGADLSEEGIGCVTFQSDGVVHRTCAKLYADCTGPNALLGGRTGLSAPGAEKAVGMEYVVPLKREPHTSDLFVDNRFPGGYGWIFPVNGQKAIIGCGTLVKERFRDIENMLKTMWELPRVRERCESTVLEKHAAVLRTGRPVKKLAGGNLVIIGDSALQANPLVGEGIRFVLEASSIAAAAVLEALKKSDVRLLKKYESEWNSRYFEKYKLAWWLQRRIKRSTIKSDSRLDFGVRRLKTLAPEEAARLLSGDLSKFFLLKIALKSLIRTRLAPGR